MPKLLMNFLLHTKNNNGSLERYHYINMNSSEANLNRVLSLKWDLQLLNYCYIYCFDYQLVLQIYFVKI